MHVRNFVGENKMLAGKAGAIDAVVTVMRAHVGNAGVSEQACRAMSNICVNKGALFAFSGFSYWTMFSS